MPKILDRLVDEWRDIPGACGNYQAHASGKIRIHPRADRSYEIVAKSRWGTYTTFKRRYSKCPGEELGSVLDRKKGYCRVTFSREVTFCRTQLVHRIVASAFLGLNLLDTTITVNHKNFDKKDNRVENLELLTQKENNHHAIAHGKINPKLQRKISDDQLEHIRKRLASGEGQKKIGRELGISNKVIHLIAKGKTYKPDDQLVSTSLKK